MIRAVKRKGLSKQRFKIEISSKIFRFSVKFVTKRTRKINWFYGNVLLLRLDLITFIYNLCWEIYSNTGERRLYRSQKTQFWMVLQSDDKGNVFWNWTIKETSSRTGRLMLVGTEVRLTQKCVLWKVILFSWKYIWESCMQIFYLAYTTYGDINIICSRLARSGLSDLASTLVGTSGLKVA